MYGLPEVHTRIECEDLIRYATAEVAQCDKLIAKGQSTTEVLRARERALNRKEYLQELLGCLSE